MWGRQAMLLQFLFRVMDSDVLRHSGTVQVESKRLKDEDSWPSCPSSTFLGIVSGCSVPLVCTLLKSSLFTIGNWEPVGPG